MGCGPSRPPPENGFQLNDKRALFRPPPSAPVPLSSESTTTTTTTEMKRFFTSKSSLTSRPKVPEPIPPPSNSNRAKEVSRCASLLRDMYTFDLEIWAMADAHVEDVPEREEMKVRANALFAEIRRIVGGWRASSGNGWREEEWRYVVEICEVVDKHGGRRYG